MSQRSLKVTQDEMFAKKNQGKNKNIFINLDLRSLGQLLSLFYTNIKTQLGSN